MPENDRGVSHHAYGVTQLEPDRVTEREHRQVVGGDLEIRRFHGRMGDDIVVALTVTPPGIDNEMGYRVLDDPISWSPDSATATFDLPHAVVTLTLKIPPTNNREPR